jgi:hypothetical protein
MYTAAIVLLTAELVVRGALESVTDVYDYPSIGC